MAEGNMSLVNEIGAMQLAIQAALGSAFKSPEVIRMMGKREPNQLRARIGELDANLKIGKIDQDARDEQVPAATALWLKRIGTRDRGGGMTSQLFLPRDRQCTLPVI